MALRVLVSDTIAPEGMAYLEAAEGIEVTDGTGWSRDELLQRIGDYHGLIVRSATRVDRELIDAAHSLRVVGRAGVGVDNVDLVAATRKGILVINSPEGNTLSTAEHTLAMMLAVARKIPQAHASLTREGKWERNRFVGVQLFGKTLGVIGLGRIGAEVAERALALGMKVMAYDPLLNEERAKRLGVILATIEEICRQADFITVHTPLTRETEGLIGEREFNMMKQGVYIINCARGGIVDEDALYHAIVSGKVAGAALDVFKNEPPTGHPLLSLEQVVVTPHLGASTHEAQVSVAVDVVRSVVRALAGEPVKYAVNAPALRAEGVDGLAPYLKLAERVGHFFTSVFGGHFERFEVIYRGEAARFDEEALTTALLKGMLEHMLHGGVNYVNARYLAEERQMRISVTKEGAGEPHPNSITLRGRLGERVRQATGIVVDGKRSVIVDIDGYAVNVATEGRILVAYNVDRPGIIGRVGTLLGEYGINIAYMQVGRKEVGSYAVMVLGIDNPLDDEVLARLRALNDLRDVRLVEWPAIT